jgi:hypothetical protein
MTEPGNQRPGERVSDELDLDKVTIQDLDLNPQDADAVKGGGVGPSDAGVTACPRTGTKPPTTT